MKDTIEMRTTLAGTKALDPARRSEILRQRNKESLDEFDWTGWNPEKSPFVTSVINAAISTMGLTAESERVLAAVKSYAFGDVTLDKRTGNTGWTIEYGIGGSAFRTVAPVQSTFLGDQGANRASALAVTSFDAKDGTITIDVGQKTTLKARVMKVPSWYQKVYDVKATGRAPDKLTGSQLVQWENNVLMIGIPESNGYQACAYLGKPETACGFCALEQGKYKPLIPDILVDMVGIDLAETGRTSITMTGGNRWGGNRGFEKYMPFVEALRKRFGPTLPVQIEASPPKDQEMLDWLVEKSVSLMSNLEVWSPEDRALVVPAKSREIPREEYLEVFRKLNELGIDTYSVLIASLQSFDNLFAGTRALAEAGTSAIILPFRPTGGVLANNTSSSPADLLRATIGGANIMTAYGAGLETQSKSYCSGCGGCGADANLRDNSLVLRADPNFQKFERQYGLDRLATSGGSK